MKNLSLQRILAFATAMTVIVGVLSACSAATHDAMTSYDGGFGVMMDSAPAEEYEYSNAESYKSYDDALISNQYSSASSTESGDVSAPADGRKLIKTVSLELETREFESFIRQMNEKVSQAGGYIESSSVNGGRYTSSAYYARNASVTARIPAGHLDDFCSGIAGISNVVNRSENTSDVTLRYYDTESHMKALQSEYETLVGILEKCTKLEDVISVQRRITDVLYQIESNKTTLNNYDNLVAYSTVTMRIQEVKEETVVTELTVGQRISYGFRGTLQDIRENCENLLVWFTVNLPYLLMWGVILVAVTLTMRSVVRRIRKKCTNREKITESASDSENHG